jgi:hypothetical protein
MTMYGAPPSNDAMSMTLATCSLLIFTAARASLEPFHRLGIGNRFGQEELDGNSLVQLQVVGRQHDTGAPRTENPVHPVLVGEDVTLANANLRYKAALHRAKILLSRRAGA